MSSPQKDYFLAMKLKSPELFDRRGDLTTLALKLCRHINIQPDQLKPRHIQEFRREDGAPDLKRKRYMHYEKRRQKKIETLNLVINSANNEEDFENLINMAKESFRTVNNHPSLQSNLNFNSSQNQMSNIFNNSIVDLNTSTTKQSFRKLSNVSPTHFQITRLFQNPDPFQSSYSPLATTSYNIKGNTKPAPRQISQIPTIGDVGSGQKLTPRHSVRYTPGGIGTGEGHKTLGTKQSSPRSISVNGQNTLKKPPFNTSTMSKPGNIDLFAIDYDTRAKIIRKLMNLQREEHAKQFSKNVEEQQKKALQLKVKQKVDDYNTTIAEIMQRRNAMLEIRKKNNIKQFNQSYDRVRQKQIEDEKQRIENRAQIEQEMLEIQKEKQYQIAQESTQGYSLYLNRSMDYQELVEKKVKSHQKEIEKSIVELDKIQRKLNKKQDQRETNIEQKAQITQNRNDYV